ncbi:MAG: SGNH/GDSL hydrolase family protein [Clostridia bacterium]|nr:SGNH/GDSL hydrolase family protein [Clostridia bacterium]
MSYKKVLFTGNSLLLGMFGCYGMCSTDPENDYCYHVSGILLEREPDCEIRKHSISRFEQSESAEDFEAWFETISPKLTPDLDLISFQLLDNVNDEARQAAFRYNFPELLRRAKERCPKARIVWIYGWYMQPAVFDFALKTAESFGIETIDIRSAHTKENESYAGQVSLNAEGEEIVVDREWITHPGNRGMRVIADIIIERLFKD